MLVEFSIMPLGAGEHVSEYVAEVLKLVDESGLDYRLHGMGTNVEGSWDEVMALIRRCHEQVAKRCSRVYTQIKIDDSCGRTDAMTSKVAAVESRLGKKLRS
ncbi:hypothetical protein AMJ85_10815 [candidate division BRC1 bacterium SM23_51]|nr:MAG: hypothetical protein AMJ85_10815 [candidate division BRC1 bacterium SM23_51]